MKVLFSVLSYYPSFITNKSINVGILFHNIDNDVRILETTNNWARVRNFDDEVDIEYLKLILKGIKEEISNENLFNYKEKFNLKKYTHFFVNELKFSDIVSVNTDNFENFVSETKKIFLRFDYDKKDRPTHQQQLAYIKNLLKDNEVEYTSRQIEGAYRENISFDYIIDGYAFKLFTFENKNLNKLVSSAKSWAYTAEEMKDVYKTIFIYDIELENNEYFEAILKILSKSAYKVVKMNEAIDFILKLKANGFKRDSFLRQNIIAESVNK
ncbi:DUF3037 domain-containing protein [Fonticella tunisiensis]|uniref:DUF3037 family protein n=1 Tax=Fonticella tunisiensis TaxID=1096341 RepID=A0A4R7KVB3_9CLOT|nr:DUF3037 domain-containing protein [Fonticella tunisiensis]TDT63441.1 DUF3037 family protein [Fonticella tunisiensis]